MGTLKSWKSDLLKVLRDASKQGSAENNGLV
jgi:hypothetical protein